MVKKHVLLMCRSLQKFCFLTQIETRNNMLEMQSVNNELLIEELDKLLERLRVPSEVCFSSIALQHITPIMQFMPYSPFVHTHALELLTTILGSSMHHL